MDIRKIKKLIELLNEAGLAEIEVREGEEAVRITQHQTQQIIAQPPIAAAPAVAAAPQTAQATVQSDASNKPVLENGLCQGGFGHFWMGGPIASASKRLHHVGQSAEHNEYMAMNMAIKRTVWLRQLFDEIGLQDLVSKPTPIFGDNIQANKLCKEHFISPGNQYIAV